VRPAASPIALQLLSSARCKVLLHLPVLLPARPAAIMSDLHDRKVFKVFNQEFIVDQRYNVTKELGQGAYGIVWYGIARRTHRSTCY
jgi:hypothetical protein